MAFFFKRGILVGMMVACLQASFAQPLKPLNVGDTVPERYLSLLLRSSTRTDSQNHMPPKLLLLHFWELSCKASLEAAPPLEVLEQKFSEQLQVFLVAPDPASRVTQTFQQAGYKPRSVAVLSGDTLLKKLFPYLTVPQHVWLTGQGEVLYITERFNATEENVRSVLNGIRPLLLPKQDDSTYAADQPLWTKVNSSTQPLVLYSSLLTKRLPGVAGGMKKFSDNKNDVVGLRVINQDLLSLFRIAFSDGVPGDFSFDNRIVLEVPDPAAFRQPEDEAKWNDWIPGHIFNYELTLPLVKKEELYPLMQAELARYFGFRGKIEERRVRCLVLCGKTDRLLSGAGRESPSFQKKEKGILSIRNKSVGNSLYPAIKYANPNSLLPILNETDDRKIDLDLKADLTDLAAVRKELRRYGLDLVEQERKLPMLVIQEVKGL